ncbi:cell division protein ZapD [Thalassotalea maritima]|uniref:cell division protein ZapD n=1 Tax=Thalassotalea maritima TaxID=3242416 RepID=UPI003527695F
MTGILYEHPLNERIRNYLRLEQLFAQARSCLNDDFAVNHTCFFNAFFSVLDTLDRTDVRGDIIKDLEKLENNLIHWSKSPDVNNKALEVNLKQAKQLSVELRSKQPLWGALKKDKFLDAIRKRFSVSGAYCGFDLPSLIHWLSLPPLFVQQDIERWLASVNVIEKSIALVLRFIRQKSPFETITANKSFYQDTGEGLLLLRIELESSSDFFPSVSGNRYRYSIRFMQLDQEKGQQYITDNVIFKLAKC